MRCLRGRISLGGWFNLVFFFVGFAVSFVFWATCRVLVTFSDACSLLEVSQKESASPMDLVLFSS